jgi:hypothetical protein
LAFVNMYFVSFTPSAFVAVASDGCTQPTIVTAATGSSAGASLAD